MTEFRICAARAGLCAVGLFAANGISYAQVVARQVVDKNGAPQYGVDPFWPKPLPKNALEVELHCFSAYCQFH